SILAFDALQPTVDEISDGLIAGNDVGLTNLLTFIADHTTELVGAALPAPIKAILDIVKPIISIVKNCDKTNPITTTTGATTTATSTTDGVVTTTTTATTTTLAIATTTTTPDCVPLIEPLKNMVRDLLVAIENLPLGDEASQLLKLAIGTNLTAYFDNDVDSAGSIAATLASTLSQIEDVIKGVQSSLGPLFGIMDPAFQIIYDLLDEIIKAASALASCTDAKPDCTGLVTLSGYAIKIGVPILRAYLAVNFPPSVLAFDVLQPTIDKIAEGLIAGNDAGLTDLLKFIVDNTTGFLGSLLPAPIKAILDVVKPVLGIIKNCNNTGTSTTTTSTATGATTTTDATTTTPDCTPLIGPIKDAIRGLLTMIEGLPFGPEASQLLKTAVGTNLTAYFDNGIDSAGSVAATLASTLPQIVDVIKGLQTSLGSTFSITDPVFQALYDAVGVFTKAASGLTACTGAKPDCTGLVVMTGYAIKIGWPILRAELAIKFPPSILAFDALQPTVDEISDGLIAGNDAGLTDFLTFVTDQTTGLIGAALPAPIKAILDVVKPILNIIKNCPK
ncbi:hypothetical protein BGZ97_011505, partial [Linnemannia gamsii]